MIDSLDETGTPAQKLGHYHDLLQRVREAKLAYLQSLQSLGLSTNCLPPGAGKSQQAIFGLIDRAEASHEASFAVVRSEYERAVDGLEDE